jgi:cytochrome c-type biogenesis protein CcmE
MSIGTKLSVGAVLLAGITMYVGYLGALSSWQYYLTVDECVKHSEQFAGRAVRVSGRVAHGSLHVEEDRSRAWFLLQGTNDSMPADCVGPLPDNLAEDIDVVVEGRLADDGAVQGDKLLTRCASKYESR